MILECSNFRMKYALVNGISYINKKDIFILKKVYRYIFKNVEFIKVINKI